MCEQLISKTAVIASVLWSLVGMLVVSAWAVVLLFPESWEIGGLLGVTACALSAGAATLHMKLYVIQVVALMRATSGLDGQESSLRALR